MTIEYKIMSEVLCRDCGINCELLFVAACEDFGVNEVTSNMILCKECLNTREVEND